MKSVFKYLGLVAALFVLSSCGFSSRADNDPTEKDRIPSIDQLLEIAADYVGEEVVVQGLVSFVCEKSGGSIFLTDGENFLRIEATGDIAYFEPEMIGHQMVFRGILKETRLNMERLERSESRALDNPEREAERRDHCVNKLVNILRMKQHLENTGEEYFSNYTMDGLDFEILPTE